MKKRVQYTWEGAREAWRRMGEAAEKAHTRWLRSLTIEESVAIFEDLSRGIPELAD